MAIPKIKRIYPKKKKRVKRINKELYLHERETRYPKRRERDDGSRSRSRKARNWEWEAEPKFHHGGPVPLLEAPEGPFSLIFFL